MNFNSKKKFVLIITFLNEYYDQNISHYSKQKGYLLANSLLKKDYVPAFLSDKVEFVETKNRYGYINPKLLSPLFLSKFSLIFFILHNSQYLIELNRNTKIFKNIRLAKRINRKLLVINKSCNYPKILNNYFNSYNFFNFIFLQTKNIIVPQSITKKIFDIKGNFSIENFNKILREIKKIKKSKISYSEMTFPNKIPIFNENKITNDENSDKTKLVFMGRLCQSNGMNILFLLKLMKILGEKYLLYIIPGSYKLPTDYESDKKWDVDLLKEYFEEYKLKYDERNIIDSWRENDFEEKDYYLKESNIIILDRYNYGDHFDIIKDFDIGIGFSDNKEIKLNVGSAKLFDYMYCKLKIVFEDGLDNCEYIKRYNFGELVPLNSTVDEFVEGIKKVEKMKKDDILYENFFEENNADKRCEDILKYIYSK